MLDRHGESFTFYNDVPGILVAARERGIPMSLASRTHAPELARDMLRGLHIPNTTEQPLQSQLQNEGNKAAVASKLWRAADFFVHPQIYPGNKPTHFRRIQAATVKAGMPVAYEDMLFFDDEGRNRNVETELGVTFWLARDGVTKEEVDRGVWEWRRRRGIWKKDLPLDGRGARWQGGELEAAEMDG